MRASNPETIYSAGSGDWTQARLITVSGSARTVPMSHRDKPKYCDPRLHHYDRVAQCVKPYLQFYPKILFATAQWPLDHFSNEDSYDNFCFIKPLAKLAASTSNPKLWLYPTTGAGICIQQFQHCNKSNRKEHKHVCYLCFLSNSQVWSITTKWIRRSTML